MALVATGQTRPDSHRPYVLALESPSLGAGSRPLGSARSLSGALKARAEDLLHCLLSVMDITFKDHLYLWVPHSLKSNQETQSVSCVMSSWHLGGKSSVLLSKMQRKAVLPFFIVLESKPQGPSGSEKHIWYYLSFVSTTFVAQRVRECLPA